MSPWSDPFTPDEVSRCRVLLHRGTGVVSAAIRWQTRSPFTHASILMPNGMVIESREFHGVRTALVDTTDGVDAFNVVGAGGGVWRDAIRFCFQHLGAGYDWTSVLRFVSRRQGRNATRWFCSELVFAAFESAGIRLLERTRAELVSPAMLSLSPLLVPSGTP